MSEAAINDKKNESHQDETSVSNLNENITWDKNKELVEKTKEEFFKKNWPMSYNDTKKMEEHFAKTFPDLNQEWILSTLQNNMPELFKNTKTYQDAQNILKHWKDWEDKNLELGKNENLYHWLKRNMEKQTESENYKDTINRVSPNINVSPKNEAGTSSDSTIHTKTHLKIPQNEAETTNGKYKTKYKKEDKQELKKSESKLWKTTKNVINRPLEHTWIGKYLIKKPIDWIKKMLRK